MRLTSLFRLGLLAAGLAVLTACNSVVTEISADGSGELHQEILASKKQVQAQPDNFCAAADPGYTVTSEKRGDNSWCIYTASFTNLNELQLLYEDLPQVGLTISQLEIRAGTVRYDASIEASQSEELTWKLTLPGKITEHNADSVQGSTLSWKIPKGGGVIRVYAESVAPDSSPQGRP